MRYGKFRNNSYSEYALSLAELLVSIAIVAVIIISMSVFFTRGLLAVKRNQALIPGYEVGKSQMEKIRRMSYDTILLNYFPSMSEDIFQNGITYNAEVNTEIIYRPEILLSGSHDGRSLIKITLKIKWNDLNQEGKKNILLQSYIYTESDY